MVATNGCCDVRRDRSGSGCRASAGLRGPTAIFEVTVTVEEAGDAKGLSQLVPPCDQGSV